ncbi:ElyC/SanA/YdcF family protein [Desulfobacterales bacterium HSG17]|nr:ElyC/SanA/YdcF family protein [Desulfobacterales bacterium HSG17]
MFMFKKIVSLILMPLPFGLLIGFAGLFLLIFTRRQKTGKVFVSFGLIFIALTSYSPFADILLSPLEKTYKKYQPDQKKISYVVVLGGGHTTDFALPLSSQIASASLTRLVEGISIYRENPGSRLIVSGWQGRYDPVPNAAVMASLANALGVPLDDIIMEPRPKDTKDEARLISIC